jgi:hypothetical protein
VEGKFTRLTEETSFKVVSVLDNTLKGDPKARMAFQMKARKLFRMVNGTYNKAREVEKTLGAIRTALSNTPGIPQAMLKTARELEYKMKDIMVEFNGNPSISRRQGNQPPSINRRVWSYLYAGFGNTAPITTTAMEQYRIVKELFPPVYKKLKSIITVLKKLEDKMEELGVPWTPGRLPELKK